jgi:hypothetical protein
VTYPGTLSLSRTHLTHLADLLRGHRARIGSRWCKLAPGRQALLVLAHLRNGDTYTRLAAGFEVGLATAFRYVREAVDLLADKGYQGAGGTVTSPHKGRNLTKAQKAHNRMVNSVRGPGERGFAILKTWPIFTKVRCCPQRVGTLARAVLTLELGPES